MSYKEILLTNEIMAANSKILIRRSSNCSAISCHKGFPVTTKIHDSSKIA